MKKIFPLLLLCICLKTIAQDTETLHQTAKTFMRQADYANAVLVLNRALQQAPNNLGMIKDLALSHYYKREYALALEVIKPILDREDVDDQSFQIAGNIYKALLLPKECEKLYKKGLKKFPESGPLYSEYGELLWTQQNFDAIKLWEAGIKADAAYSKNYYNAARFYYLSKNKIWGILYGEIFLNMEPQNSGSAELKSILLDSYKKLYAEANLKEIASKEKNEFAKAFLEAMDRQSGQAAYGINTASLTMIRTRFILDWYATNAAKFPYKLFDYQQQLLKDGFFEAYNQWLFAPADNLNAYQNWVDTHSAENGAFFNFQKARLFKVPGTQYYQD